jgi:hypothetical protein
MKQDRERAARKATQARNMGAVARGETTSDTECSKREYAAAARGAFSRFLELKTLSDEERRRPRVLSKPHPVRNFNSGLLIAPTACLFYVGDSQASLDADWSAKVVEGDITVTRTIDGAIKVDRITLPDYTAASVVSGLQKHCVWASLLSDTQRYFASAELGVLDAEPRTIESVFSASTWDGKGYIGGRLVFKFRGYDSKPYWAAFDAVIRRGGCSIDFFRYYPDVSKAD